MRFLTPAEQRLLDSLPEREADVLRAFFEETDARLIPDETESVVPSVPVPLFEMRKKEADVADR